MDKGSESMFFQKTYTWPTGEQQMSNKSALHVHTFAPFWESILRLQSHRKTKAYVRYSQKPCL